MEQQYNIFMNLALAEAQKALIIDEVPIGAIIIDQDGHIIASAYNQVIRLRDSTAHAEISAIRLASQFVSNYRLLNTTLYVTVEPCAMCAGAIIHARIKKVVYGTKDLKWGAFGSLFDFSKDNRLNHRVEIVSGIMEEECRTLIQNFFQEKRKSK